MAINARIALKHSTEADWQKAINFIPLAGEIIIYDADANNPVRYKIGDGTTNVNALPFATGTAVLYTSQALTNEQKEQARTNIGAISVADIPEVPVTSVAGKTGAVTLTKSDVGLGNVTNESKATMFASPAFTGTPTAPTAENTIDNTQVATTAFVHNVVNAISPADLGLEQAMKFLGTTTTDISDASNIDTIIIGSGTVKVEAGNVVLYNGYEYVWTGSAWEQLGQEGSFALKSIAISAGNGLEGGGDLTANRTISHADTSSVSNITAADRTYVKSLTFDDFGHVTAFTTGTETVTDTTYDEATTSTAGLMSAADKTFVDGVQAQLDGKMNATNPMGSGNFSMNESTASSTYSFAIGFQTHANNIAAFAQGWGTKAYGSQSHAEGYRTIANGHRSHTEGDETIADCDDQHVQGRYNIADSTSAHIVGNGNSTGSTDGDFRSNAYTLDWDGNGWFAGDVYVGSTSGTNKDEGSVKLATVADLNNKVDKVSGKGLSTNDYTTDEKNKLAGIAAGATANTGTITAVQANGTDVATSGTANIPAASTSAYGVTKLSSATDSTSTDLAATASAVKSAYDTAAAAMPKSGGTFTGATYAQANTSYTTYQLRNIALSTSAATPTGNGSILGVYS